MSLRHAVATTERSLRTFHPIPSIAYHSSCRVPVNGIRQYHNDGRNRLSTFWAPTGGIEKRSNPVSTDDKEDSSALLHRAGFLRQSHAGIFDLLPLGLLVQSKLERLVDKHMRSLYASKLSLSSFASEELWDQSGRLATGVQELFKLEDRKGGKFLLSPTHEEKITQLVSGVVGTETDLPIRVYQVSRKYRDEVRPRGGLLRAREFVMKDLYTFDKSHESAIQTYQGVRAAYRRFFNELGIKYLEAEADSGAIGGDLSHEFHFPSSVGEDTLVQCQECSHVINEERLPPSSTQKTIIPCPKCNSSSTTKIPAIEVGHTFHLGTRYSAPLNATFAPVAPASSSTTTRSSEPETAKTPIQMGCHGIGISRLIAASAACLSDSKGLNWPKAIAPFSVVVIPGKASSASSTESIAEDGVGVYDLLSQPASFSSSVSDRNTFPRHDEILLDDRPDVTFIWKMNDADLIGYPIIVLLGRKWTGGEGGKICEVQCRRLGVKTDVKVEDLRGFVEGLWGRL